MSTWSDDDEGGAGGKAASRHIAPQILRAKQTLRRAKAELEQARHDKLRHDRKKDKASAGKDGVDPDAGEAAGRTTRSAVYKHAVQFTSLKDDHEEEEEGGKKKGSEEEEAADEADEVDTPKGLLTIKKHLLRLVDALELPANPLDQLTELLGGEEKVAEMTGRKGMLKRDAESGKVFYVQRGGEEAQKMVNITEKDKFMDDRKQIAIISEAASTGISLQADRRVKNQRRRFHITLELPWSADKAIQQFGRSHRSNQTSAPVYCMLITKCAGEYRFAGAVAKRLQSLGALLQGDRRAQGVSGQLKAYDVDNKWGAQALERVYSDLGDTQAAPMPGVVIPDAPWHTEQALREAAMSDDPKLKATEFYEHMKQVLADAGLLTLSRLWPGGPMQISVDAKVTRDIPRFLNRLLGMPLLDQKLLFDYFVSTLDAFIKRAKGQGIYEGGIEVVSETATVRLVKSEVIHTDTASGATTSYMELEVDDGMKWEEALRLKEENLAQLQVEEASEERMDKVGFYEYRRSRSYNGAGHPLVLLATEVPDLHRSSKYGVYRVMRPQAGQGSTFKEWELFEKYKPISDEAGKKLWAFWYDYLHSHCLHGKSCVRRQKEGSCYFGSRLYIKYIISGAVLPVMQKILATVLRNDKKKNPRALRAKLADGTLVVGLNLSAYDAESVRTSITM